MSSLFAAADAVGLRRPIRVAYLKSIPTTARDVEMYTLQLWMSRVMRAVALRWLSCPIVGGVIVMALVYARQGSGVEGVLSFACVSIVYVVV
jgi:hypothetical protein